MGWQDTLSKGWDAVVESDIVKSGTAMGKATWRLERIESNLDDVKASDINISLDKESNLGTFIQTSLGLLGQNVPVTGKVGPETITELNGFFAGVRETAIEEAKENYESASSDESNEFNKPTEPDYGAIGPKNIGDITKLTGPHLVALISELRDRDILETGADELLQSLGSGLRDIDNSDLQDYANDLDPKIEDKPEPKAEEEGINMEDIGKGAGNLLKGMGIEMPKMPWQ